MFVYTGKHKYTYTKTNNMYLLNSWLFLWSIKIFSDYCHMRYKWLCDDNILPYKKEEMDPEPRPHRKHIIKP